MGLRTTSGIDRRVKPTDARRWPLTHLYKFQGWPGLSGMSDSHLVVVLTDILRKGFVVNNN